MTTESDLAKLHNIIENLDEAVLKYDSKNKIQKELFG